MKVQEKTWLFNVEKIHNTKNWKVFSIFGEDILVYKKKIDKDTERFSIGNFVIDFSKTILEKMEIGENLTKEELRNADFLSVIVNAAFHPTSAKYPTNAKKCLESVIIYTPYQKVSFTKEGGILMTEDFDLSIGINIDIDSIEKNPEEKERFSQIVFVLDSIPKDLAASDSFSDFSGLYEQTVIVSKDYIATSPKVDDFHRVSDTLFFASFAIQYPVGNKPMVGVVFLENETNLSMDSIVSKKQIVSMDIYLNGNMVKMSSKLFFNGNDFMDIIRLKSIPSRTNLSYGKVFFNIAQDSILLLNCENMKWKESSVDWINSLGTNMKLSSFNFMTNKFVERDVLLAAKEKNGYTIQAGEKTKVGLRTSEFMRVNFKDLCA